MNVIDMSQVKLINSLLGDEISKDIFVNRLMYSITDDPYFIRNVASTNQIVKKIYDQMKHDDRPKGIFGAGSVGKRLVRNYPDIAFKCYIDNFHSGENCEGLPIISLKDFIEKYPEGIIVISTNLYWKEILLQLKENGIGEERIINIGKEYEKLNHLQYFDLPQLNQRHVFNEVFVDGGCYDGNTSLDFIRWCSNFEEIGENYVYAWEPDKDNHLKARKIFEKYDIKHQLIKKGLWNEQKALKLQMNGKSSTISDAGDINIEVDSIDNVCRLPVTFIKMDVEGAEKMALLGAKNTIVKYKPKLAICIYHRPEDIWELPILIHQLNSNYKLYLRHYSFTEVETVLYAL